MHHLISILPVLAAQQPPAPLAAIPEGIDPVVWPYWVAIGAMSSAVVALFGYVQKIQNDNRADVKANSQRIAAEFKIKDESILDIATKITEAVAQFIGAIEKLADKNGALAAEVRSESESITGEIRTNAERLQARLERIEDKLDGREPRNRSE